MGTLREQMPLKKIKIIKKTITGTLKSILGSLFFLWFFVFIYMSPSTKSKYLLIPILIILLYVILSPIISFSYNRIYLKK
jgi:hypothetical protein